MPKSTRRGGRTVVISGSAQMSMTVANGNTSVAFGLLPSTIVRLVNVAKGFEFYRFTRLAAVVAPCVRYETSTPNNTTAVAAALGYYPEETTATTTSLTTGNVLSLDASHPFACTVVNVNAAAPSGGQIQAAGNTNNFTLKVPRKVLLSTPVKWYRTQGASTETTDVQQGTFFFALQDAAGANTVQLHSALHFTCEFTGDVDSSMITAELPKAAPIPLPVSLEIDDEKETYVKVVNGRLRLAS